MVPSVASFRLCILVLLFSTLSIASTQCAAQTNRSYSASYKSGILFPETESWPLFEEAPKLPPEEFDNLAKILAQELRARMRVSYGSLPDNSLCSTVDRLFEQANLESFRLIDINQDGVSDIVYSGSAQCREGDLTIAWLGSKSGYAVQNGFIWPVLLVRTSLNSDQIVSVKVGCCDDLKDTFLWGNINNIQHMGAVFLLRGTILPRRTYYQSRVVKIERKINLRSSPEVINSYVNETSEIIGHAVQGNIVRTYLPGSKSHVLYTTTINGKTWYFAIMDDESVRLVTSDPYKGVNAGWFNLSY